MLASAIHAAAFTAGNVVLVKPAEYGVQEGEGAVEVSLVAALPAAEEVILPTESIKPAEVFEPEEEALQEERKATAPAVKETGDGSSTVPGKDRTTLYSSGGAETEAKPTYLKNPPPLYPEAARRFGQEGLVILAVNVTRSGYPDSVVVKESSGFYLLDEAAVKAVRRWKFDPARLGTLSIESRVEVPIRFRLEDK